MKFILPEPIKKALLEGARVSALGVVSYLLTEGVMTTLVNYFLGVYLDPTLKLVIVGLITSGLRSVDKWLHEKSDKGTGFLGQKGLTGF